MFAVSSRIFRIVLVVLLCLGLFTTGVARACLCDEHCICCESRGLQYAKEVGERCSCHTGRTTTCNFRKCFDIFSYLGCDDREDSSDIADTIEILTDILFDKHPVAYSAGTPCDRVTSKASAIHLISQPLLC